MSPDDSAATQVIRREFECDIVTDTEHNPHLPHLAAEMCDNEVRLVLLKVALKQPAFSDFADSGSALDFFHLLLAFTLVLDYFSFFLSSTSR